MAMIIINIIAMETPAYIGTLFEFCKSQNEMSCFEIKILNEKNGSSNTTVYPSVHSKSYLPING